MWTLAALAAVGAALARRFAGRRSEGNPTGASTGTPVLLLALYTSAGGVAIAQTVVVAVLPVLGRQLGVSAAAAAWLITAFMLAAAVTTPVAGRLGDLHGYRRVMLASLALLVAGSVFAAAADHVGSFAGLLLGRVVQGLSAGVFPVAFGMARRSVAPSRLPGVVAGLSAMFGVGGAVGLVLAGPLIEVLGTPSLFWLCAGLGLVALAGAVVVREPERPAPSGSLDVAGALLLSVVLVAVLLAVSQVRTWGWGPAAALVIAASAAAAAFVLVELRAAAPVVDLRLLRRRPVAAVDLATFVVSVGMFAAVTLIPQFAQAPPAVGYGFGTSATGLLIAPMAMIMLVAAPLGARLTARVGGRATFQVGALLAGAALLASAVGRGAPWQLAGAGAVLGLAYGLAFAALGTLVVGAVRPEETGAATGVNTILRTVGGAVGAQAAAAIVTPAAGPPTDGGFTLAFLVAAAAALLAAISARAIPRSSRTPRSADPPSTRRPRAARRWSAG